MATSKRPPRRKRSPKSKFPQMNYERPLEPLVGRRDFPTPLKPNSVVPWHIWGQEKKQGGHLKNLLKTRRLATIRSRAKRLLALDNLSINPASKSTKTPTQTNENQRRHGLEPAIWQGLPHDIIFNIIDHLDVSDRISWSCVSRDFFSYTTSKIWSRLSISSTNLEAHALRGTFDYRNILPFKAHLILFLVNHAFRLNPSLIFSGLRSLDDPLHMYRPNAMDNKFINIAQLPAPLPGHLVKSLKLGPFTGQRQKAPTSTVLYTLSKHLPNVEECVVEGRLYTYFLAHVLAFKNLTHLDFRSDLKDEIIDTHTTNPISFLLLNFGRLTTLKRLSSLKIGCLLLQEAKSLAESVSALRLKTLDISCSRTGYDDRDKKWIYEPKTANSPLIRFLVEIQGSQSEDMDPETKGFPDTLQKLLLRDDWHQNIQNLHQHISAAIAPCQDLNSLTISNRIDFKRYKNLKSFPFYSDSKILALYSWQQLSNRAKPGLLFEYRTPTREVRWTGVLPDTEQRVKFRRSVAKSLDHLLPNASSKAPIRKTIRFTKPGNVPSNAIAVLPRRCEHGIFVHLCYTCGKAYEFDEESIEDLVENLRGWGRAQVDLTLRESILRDMRKRARDLEMVARWNELP